MTAVGAIVEERGATFGHAFVPHPYAELFPMIEGEAFAALVEDVRENGIREPIVMLDGKVLDGRNRYLAARECGRPIVTTEYAGDDPLGFVISLNLKRRHLSESQRAVAAARIANLPRGANQHTATAAPSQAVTAKMLNVSVDSIQRAHAVTRDGAPALVAEVEAGRVSVRPAAEVARLPEAEQTALVERGPGAVREAAAIQRADLSDEEKAARRAAIIAGAERAGRRPAPSRKNPDYQPNPALDAIAFVAGQSSEIASRLFDKGAAFILSGAIDDAMLGRCLKQMRDGRDALNTILEQADAAQAAR